MGIGVSCPIFSKKRRSLRILSQEVEMDLNDLRKEPHLSASAIGDYIDCGLLYKLGRIDRLPPEFRADALEFGSCIHLALADFHKQKMDGKTMTAKELHEQFERYWKAAAEGYENIQYAEGKSFETLLMEGKELLTTYYHKCPTNSSRF